MSAITIGTRGSTLALWQAEWVARELRERHSGLNITIERIVAPADAAPDVPLAELGTKGLFTATIEEALRQRRVDLAVHSMKDLASVTPPHLTLAATPAREDPRDALIASRARSLDDLPRGARVGTSAPRRRAQLRHLRPDLQIVDVRGNVDTRLRKLQEGHFDALVLAAAGLHRLGRTDAITTYLDTDLMLPAGGQGALGIQARADDARVLDLVAPLADPDATACCRAERRLQEVLEGGCRVPIGALARIEGHMLRLDAVVASEDGTLCIRDTLTGPRGEPSAIGERLAERLLALGAAEVLGQARTSQARPHSA